MLLTDSVAMSIEWNEFKIVHSNAKQVEALQKMMAHSHRSTAEFFGFRIECED